MLELLAELILSSEELSSGLDCDISDRGAKIGNGGRAEGSQQRGRWVDGAYTQNHGFGNVQLEITIWSCKLEGLRANQKLARGMTKCGIGSKGRRECEGERSKKSGWTR